MILIDTDVCIELLRGNKNVIGKRKECDDAIGLSFMSVAELFYGAEKSGKSRKNKMLVEEFLLNVRIINSDLAILKRFGEIKAVLDREGTILPDADIFIAATALEKCSKLITGNISHFKRIHALKVENWIS